MTSRLDLEILPQPDDTTCGPTCLHALYRYHGDDISLDRVIAETGSLEEGGTLAVLLAHHAMRRGYRATIFTWNLQLFDPTWFGDDAPDLAEKLTAQAEAKDDARLRMATDAYLEFLRLGGRVRLEDLRSELIRRYLKRSLPILTGLNSNYLYRSEREFGPECELDDVRGVPVGHFVLLSAYDTRQRTVTVADPYEPNPMAEGHHYDVTMARLVGAILLGCLTYDSNLLILEPPRQRTPS